MKQHCFPQQNSQTAQTAFFVFVIAVTFMIPDAAHAASSVWVEKFVDFIDLLRTDGAKLIIALGGLGLTVYLGYGALAGDVPWRRVGYAVFGTLGALFLPDGLAEMIESLN